MNRSKILRKTAKKNGPEGGARQPGPLLNPPLKLYFFTVLGKAGFQKSKNDKNVQKSRLRCRICFSIFYNTIFFSFFLTCKSNFTLLYVEPGWMAFLTFNPITGGMGMGGGRICAQCINILSIDLTIIDFSILKMCSDGCIKFYLIRTQFHVLLTQQFGVIPD